MSSLHLWQAAILGIVEGITEYLPVSSTGHLILASSLMGLDQAGPTKRDLDAFEIIIQGGAILAVLGLYRQRVMQMIRGLLGMDRAGLRLAINILIAFLPAAIFGLKFHHLIEEKLFYSLPVMAALAIGGVIMILIGRWHNKENAGDKIDDHSPTRGRFLDIDQLTWRHAIIVGLLQCLSLWPGTSRSMVTIVGGMLVGLGPRRAAEFSFLLGLPTLGGACLYSAAKNFAGHNASNMIQTLGAAPMIIGLLVATISAALAVKWLVTFLTNHGLAIFGWYRLVLCAVLLVLVWRGLITIAPAADANQTPAASTRP